MRSCRFNLNLTAEQCQRYYEGRVRCVVASNDEGVRMAFPASELRRFVTHRGVHGRFEIRFDTDYKLVSLQRLHP